MEYGGWLKPCEVTSVRSSSDQHIEVIARLGSVKRRAVASGRDIYAITTPLVVEATERVVSGRAKMNGVVAAGEVFDAHDFLRSLCPEHLTRYSVMPLSQERSSKDVASRHVSLLEALIDEFVPCHRLIEVNGDLGGHGGGMVQKQWLIK